MSDDRRERLAVALTDLDRVPPEVRTHLLAGRLDLSQAIRVGQDRMEDVPAVVFSCDLLTAAIVCDMLRSNDRKVGDAPTGLYINKNQSWSRITNNTVLTVVINGKAKLNPKVFPSDAMVGTPPPVKRFSIGAAK